MLQGELLALYRLKHSEQLTTSRKTIDDFPTRLSPSRITLKSAAVDDFRFMRKVMRPLGFFLMVGFMVKFSILRESSNLMPLKSLSVSSVPLRKPLPELLPLEYRFLLFAMIFIIL